MSWLLRRLLVLSVVLSCLVASSARSVAWAQQALPESVEVAKARDYFRAGAQAYSVGAYAAAVQAFEQAYELAPRPAVLFSIAQAEKRLYFLLRERVHLEKALRLYREYLTEAPEAARKLDATQAIAELEPLLAAAAPLPPAASAASSPSQPAASPTRIMIASPAEGASIAVDGAAPQPSPLILEVAPGEHTAQITAPGYLSDERRIFAVQGSLVNIDVSLKEQPAKLHVLAPDGAELSIDGRLQGTCPFPRPLELGAGNHLITITKHGYEPWSEERHLERGKSMTVLARLPRTLQRTSSLILFGASASATTAACIFAAFALSQENSAQNFLEQRGEVALSSADLAEYKSVRNDRDNLRLGALASAGVGVVLAATGGLLFSYDAKLPTPTPLATAARQRLAPRANATLAPGVLGLTVTQEF